MYTRPDRVSSRPSPAPRRTRTNAIGHAATPTKSQLAAMIPSPRQPQPGMMHPNPAKLPDSMLPVPGSSTSALPQRGQGIHSFVSRSWFPICRAKGSDKAGSSSSRFIMRHVSYCRAAVLLLQQPELAVSGQTCGFALSVTFYGSPDGHEEDQYQGDLESGDEDETGRRDASS